MTAEAVCVDPAGHHLVTTDDGKQEYCQRVGCAHIRALGDEAGPLQHQEGGSHYKDMKIQPIEYIFANGLGYAEGNVVKYVSRWKSKGGVEDLRKARHYLDLLIERAVNAVEGA